MTEPSGISPSHDPYRLIPIGTIRTPFQRLEDCPRNGRCDPRPCTIELFSNVAEGLLGIEPASHLHVLYWLDRADRAALVRPTPHDGVPRGVFATRSPSRPNPIALSVVRLVERDGTRLTVLGLDCLDGTPLIDLKPYVPASDRIDDASLTWMDR